VRNLEVEVKVESHNRAPSMWDVARAAGVSQKTVSRVVNAEPNVRSEVRLRVERVIAELGYRPNQAARALVTSRTRTVGMITMGSSLLGPASLIQGVEDELATNGFSLALQRTRANDRSGFVAAVDSLLERGVEGLVISEPGDASVELTPAHVRIPVLVLEDRDLGHKGWLIAAADTRDGARAMTEALLDLGHATVHHVAGPRGWGTAETRLEGWRDALAERGCPVPAVVRGDWSAASGHAAGRALAADPAVTAVLCANDEMAVGVLRAFQEAGREAPSDVSVAGIDDAPISAYLHTPLSTVAIDFTAIARTGVTNLLAAMSGAPDVPERVTVPARPVFRSSTGPPPAARLGPGSS
jgi:DNA-binding LacI/PurR family transcriptional regulator